MIFCGAEIMDLAVLRLASQHWDRHEWLQISSEFVRHTDELLALLEIPTINKRGKQMPREKLASQRTFTRYTQALKQLVAHLNIIYTQHTPEPVPEVLIPGVLRCIRWSVAAVVLWSMVKSLTLAYVVELCAELGPATHTVHAHCASLSVGWTNAAAAAICSLGLHAKLLPAQNMPFRDLLHTAPCSRANATVEIFTHIIPVLIMEIKQWTTADLFQSRHRGHCRCCTRWSYQQQPLPLVSLHSCQLQTTHTSLITFTCHIHNDHSLKFLSQKLIHVTVI